MAVNLEEFAEPRTADSHSATSTGEQTSRDTSLGFQIDGHVSSMVLSSSQVSTRPTSPRQNAALSPKLSFSSQGSARLTSPRPTSARPTSPHQTPSRPTSPSRKSIDDIAIDPPTTETPGQIDGGTAEGKNYADDFEDAIEQEPIEPASAELEIARPAQSLLERLKTRANSRNSMENYREPTPDVNEPDRAGSINEERKRSGRSITGTVDSRSRGANSDDVTPNLNHKERKESVCGVRSSGVNSADVTPVSTEEERKASGHDQRSSRIQSDVTTPRLTERGQQELEYEKRNQSQKSNMCRNPDATSILKDDERRVSHIGELEQSGRLSVVSHSRSSRIQSKCVFPDLSEDEQRRSGSEELLGSKSRNSRTQSKDVTPDLSGDERRSLGNEGRRQTGKFSVVSKSRSSRIESKDATSELSESERRSSGSEERRQTGRLSVVSKSRSSRIQSKDVTSDLSEDEQKCSGNEDRRQTGKLSVISKSRNSRIQSKDVTPDISEDERRHLGSDNRRQIGRLSVVSKSRSSRIEPKGVTSDLNENERRSSSSEERRLSRKPSIGSKSRNSRIQSKDVTPDLSESERRSSHSEEQRLSRKPSIGSKSRNSRIQTRDVTLDLSESERRSSGSEKRRLSRKPSIGSKSRNSRIQTRDVTPDLSEDERRSFGNEGRRQTGRFSIVSKSRSTRIEFKDVTSDLSENERRSSDTEEMRLSRKTSIGSKCRISSIQSKDVCPGVNEDGRRILGSDERRQPGRSGSVSSTGSSRLQYKEATADANDVESWIAREGIATADVNDDESCIARLGIATADVDDADVEDEESWIAREDIAAADVNDEESWIRRSGNVETNVSRRTGTASRSSSVHSTHVDVDISERRDSDSEERKQARRSSARQHSSTSRINVTEEDLGFCETDHAEGSHSRISLVDLRGREPDALLAVVAETLGPWNEENSEGLPDLILGNADDHDDGATEGEYDASDSRPVGIGAVEDVSPTPMRVSVTRQEVPEPRAEAGQQTETLRAGSGVPEQEQEPAERAETVMAMERLPKMSGSIRSGGISVLPKNQSHASVGITSIPTPRKDIRPVGSSWLKRDGSWRCAREFGRHKSDAPRMTTLSVSSRLHRSTRQPWGTIVPPTFHLGHQKLPPKEIDNVVSRLYYVPQPKQLPEFEGSIHRNELTKNNIQNLVTRLSAPLRPVPEADRRMKTSSNYQKGVLGSYAWNGEPMYMTRI